MSPPRPLAAAGAALLALAAGGCFPARYAAQAARGQLGILRAARPIHEAVADGAVPARTKRLLLAVGAAKAFGEEEGLRPTGNYRRYADLGRPAAVWVVQACPPLSFDVRTWRLPLVGSMPYLGWFDLAAARAHADRLAREEGLDVDVRGAEAYSTLGWFEDPVLSTMISPGDEALGGLVNVVLHESVHATIYVNGQSAFDESLASFVADSLTPAFLARALGEDAPELRIWAAAQARHRARVERLRRAHAELDALYRSPASDEEKRAKKAGLLAAAQADLGLRRPLNNAVLAGFRAYESGGAAFARLHAACGRRWPRTLRALSSLRAEEFDRPQQVPFDGVLDALARRACGYVTPPSPAAAPPSRPSAAAPRAPPRRAGRR